jgi:heme A synthase
MKTLVRLGVVSLVLTYVHLVFGGIVRISGSGMGCGDHWPKCNGAWLPPLDNPLVVIEWTHRLVASLVILSIATLTFAAWRNRHEADVGGPRGVLAASKTALVLVIAVALLGMVTVKLGNSAWATVAHWTLALALLAVIAAAVVRAGGLGGASARVKGGTQRAVRSLGAGAALAFLAVVFGGVVAKFPAAAIACPGFPFCGATPSDVPSAAAHVQVAHRIIAYVLVFHVLAISVAIGRRRNEGHAVKRAAKLSLALVLLQIVIGASMVVSLLPPQLRAAHQMVGIAVWLSMFVAAYLASTARMGHGTSDMGVRAPRHEPISDASMPASGGRPPMSGVK